MIYRVLHDCTPLPTMFLASSPTTFPSCSLSSSHTDLLAVPQVCQAHSYKRAFALASPGVLFLSRCVWPTDPTPPRPPSGLNSSEAYPKYPILSCISDSPYPAIFSYIYYVTQYNLLMFIECFPH